MPISADDELKLDFAWGVIDRGNDQFIEIDPSVGAYTAFIRYRLSNGDFFGG